MGSPPTCPRFWKSRSKYDLPVVSDACQAHGAHDWRQATRRFWYGPVLQLLSQQESGGLRRRRHDWSRIAIRLPNGFACYVTTDRSRRTSTKCWASTAVSIRCKLRFLAVKLRYLAEGNELRRAAAAQYRELLADNPIWCCRPNDRMLSTCIISLWCNIRSETSWPLTCKVMACSVEFTIQPRFIRSSRSSHAERCQKGAPGRNETGRANSVPTDVSGIERPTDRTGLCHDRVGLQDGAR